MERLLRVVDPRPDQEFLEIGAGSGALTLPLAARARRVTDMHVMLQAEVAARIAAAPGGKDYGILSVLYALFADVDLALRFRPGAFAPPPRVSSALLRVRFLDHPRAEIPDLRSFERLVQTAFARRRRTLENNLQDSYANLKEHLRLVHIEGSRRAETLSVVEFARLARALAKA